MSIAAKLFQEVTVKKTLDTFATVFLKQVNISQHGRMFLTLKDSTTQKG